MKLKTIAAAILVTASIFSSGSASATIVDISAMDGTGVSLSLTAGDYLVSWIGKADGGLYDAWTAWSDQHGWLNAFVVTTSSGDTVHYTGTGPDWYPSTADALAAAKESSPFHLLLASDETVRFWIGDNPYYDNSGGVSLDVTGAPSAVPLPAALPLMLSGLGMLGFAARRRKNTAV